MKRGRPGWMFAVIAVCTVMTVVTAQMSTDTWRRAAALPDVKGKQSVMARIQKSTARELTIRYKVPELEVNELGGATAVEKKCRLLLGNAPLAGNAGKPVLPVVPVQFVVPAGCEIASVTVTGEKKTTVKLQSMVEYGNTPVPLVKDANVKRVGPDESIYRATRGYPYENKELVSVQNKRGAAIGIVKVFPVTYFPQEQMVEICKEMVVTVTFREAAKIGRQHLRVRATAHDLKKLGCENPEILSGYQQPQSKAMALPGVSDQQSFLDPKDAFQYVVVTSEAMRDAKTDVTVNDLLAQRRSAGITATLVTIESILKDYTGVDDAEKLRNFIIDAFNNWETEYVVLGGDVKIIPQRQLYSEGEYVPSDFYYQCLDGSFNGDGDKNWGEPNDGEDGGDIDLFADVYVGRISAETPEEMSNAVYKILAYENEDPAEDYLRRSCMVGEQLGDNFGPGIFGYAKPFMNEIKNGSSAAGYETKGFLANASETVDSLDDWDAFWPTDSIVSLINSNRYSVLNHLGHANTNYVMKMYNESADSLKNDKFLFVLSQGCYPGDFSDDCIAEHLTTSNRHGLFAGVFNAHYGYGQYNTDYENLDAPSQRIDRQFWDAFFGEYLFNLGAINADSHEDNVWDINGDLIRYCIYETNLFGDPYTMLKGQVLGPNLLQKFVTVDDRNGGNGDRIINPGESFELSLRLQNTGSEAATGVTAAVTISDPYITVSSGSISYGDIKCCGALATSAKPAVVSVAAECPTPYAFPLSVSISDNAGNSWIATVNLTVHNSYTISGTVRTITGVEPIAGAIVSIGGPVGATIATDEKGEYRFAGIEGTYTVSAVAEGYIASDTVSVELPPDITGIDFSLGRPAISVTPAAIQQVLAVGDSTDVALQVLNSGDVDLLVTPSCGTGSVVLGRKAPALVAGKKERDLSVSYTADAGPRDKISSKPKSGTVLSGTLGGGTLKILYLTTILWSSEDTDILVDGMRALPEVASVDVLNGEMDTPDLAYLMNYDAVVVSSDYAWADPLLLGNTLADYVDEGGKLCMMVASIANSGPYGLEGRIITDEFMPIEMGGPGDMGTDPTFSEHDITRGLKTLTCMIPVLTTQVRPNGVSLGTFSNGLLVGAAHTSKPVVAINVFPSDYAWDGDLVPMVGNVFKWFGTMSWLKVAPTGEQLVVRPGESAELIVSLNAARKQGGLYTGEVRLSHNVPGIAPVLSVPVELTIDGFKSLAVTPAVLDFGRLWLGLRDTMVLTFSNEGTEKCVVGSITSDNPAYSVITPLPLSIYAGRSASVAVRYAPDILGVSSASIGITSDAEDNPSIIVGAAGECTPGPEAQVRPDALTFEFGPHDSPADQTAVLANIGHDVMAYHTYIKQVSGPKLEAAAATAKKKRDLSTLIYSPYNYRNEFAHDRVIVAFKEGAKTFAQPMLAEKLGSGNVRELAVARVPLKKTRVYTGKKLALVPLANATRDGVLEAIKLIRQDENVAYAEPDYIVKAIGIPDDPLFDQQYALNNNGQTGGTADADIDAVEGWDIATGEGSRVILGIIDTGIDYLNPDLAGNIWINENEIPANGIDDDGNGYVDDVYGYDFAYDDNDPMDVYGHGTHCSGIAAGRGNDGVGICGVSWGARVLAAKFLDDGGSGYTSDAVDAITYATAMGATITSNSWGGGGYEQSLYDVIAASGLFVAAAGNTGSDADLYPEYPAAYDLDNIISVAATDHNDKIAYFSTYGRETVDLGAPGVDILSCLPGGSHEAWSGTSMATPHVSGCAVLLKDYNPFISTEELKNAILKGVDPVPGLDGMCTTGGRLNLKKSLESVSPPWLTIAPNTAGTLDPSTEQEFTVTANPAGIVAGTWVADVVFKTNDPFTPDHPVRVTATIEPCRSIRAAGGVDFGTVWVSRDTVVNAVLVNDCNAPVTITAATFSSSLFTDAGMFPVVVKPFGRAVLPVRFTPTAAGTIDGTVTVRSDAEDNPSLTVTMHGNAVKPPKINVKPKSINVALAPAKSVGKTVTLTNSGGAEYRFKVKKVAPTGSTRSGVTGNLGDATVFVSIDMDSIRQLDLATGKFVGNPIAKPTDWGGSEGMAYDGEYIYFTNNSREVSVLDPQSGKVVRTIVCDAEDGIDGLGVTSDYIVLGSSWYNEIYVCDKETGARVTSWVENYYYGSIACSETRQSVFAFSWENYSIIERSLEDGSVINEIKVDNEVLGMGYSEAAGVLVTASPWNGVSAVDPDNGSVIATYPVTGVFALAADEAGVSLAWIATSVKEGVVPAGGSATFTATLSAAKKFPGVYEGTIQIQHAIPYPPGPFDIPCAMLVAAESHCAASTDSVKFAGTWLGRTDTLPLWLVNSGNVETNVLEVALSNKQFSVLNAAPFIIPPFDSVLVPVCFTPTKAGAATAKVTFTSDAMKKAVVKVGLAGTCVNPPVISFSPDHFEQTMLPGKTKDGMISLLNTGGAAYAFKVSVNTIEDGAKMSGGRRFLGISWNNLYGVDPQTLTITDSVPGSYMYGPCAYDGKNLYVVRDWNNVVDVYDPKTGLILGSITVCPEGEGYAYEIGVDDKDVMVIGWTWSKDSSSNFFRAFNKQTGALSVEWSTGGCCDGLSCGRESNTVYMYNYCNGTLDTRSKSDGTILTSVPMKEYGYMLSYSQSLGALVMSDGYFHTVVNPDNGEVIRANELPVYMQLAADEGSSVNWISTAADSGTVAAGGSFNLPLTFNSDHLLPGTYKATVSIAHVKGWQPGPFVIPCEITVLPLARLTVTPASIDFGTVAIGTTSSIELTLENTGNRMSKVLAILNLNSAFSMDSPPIEVPPFGTTTVHANFTPSAAKTVKNTAIIISDAIDLPIRTVSMKGTGVNAAKSSTLSAVIK